MLTKKQANIYAAVTLDILHKLHIDATPENLANQMDLTYVLYNKKEIKQVYEKIIRKRVKNE